MSSAIFVKSHPMFIQVQFCRWVQPSSTVWRLCQGNCVKRPQKYNSAKISLIYLYVQNREWILRLDEVIATLKDSTESPSSAIWGWRFQSTMVRGKIVHFSVESYIMGPDMTESACFRTVSGAVKVFTFTDRHLVIEDFIHHDKACISALIFEAASFKML
jgi:hypothetical protein